MDFIFDPSLVLYLPLYKMDGASFMSKDAHGHLCSVTGALWRPGGYYFDGIDDQIDCGDVISPLVTNAITVEIFLELIAAPQSSFWLGQMQPAAVGYNWGLYHTTTEVFYLMNASDTEKNVAATSVATVNNPCHIVGTYDGAYLRIYFNGVEEGTPTAQTGNIKDSSYNVRISKWNNREIEHIMGEARVYNRALTPQEVLHNYLATKWRYR